MSKILQEVSARAGGQCELCGSKNELTAVEVKPSSNRGGDDYVLLCGKCANEFANPATADVSHWRCLNDAMWSPVPAVQVVSYRMLNQLKSEGWPLDLLEQMYMEEEVLAWSKAGLADENAIPHKDSNGAVLNAGDTVVLIKDLEVKGANFTAKRGTAVRGITLVHNNPEQIEGRVNGQHIVILTQFVKKS